VNITVLVQHFNLARQNLIPFAVVNAIYW